MGLYAESCIGAYVFVIGAVCNRLHEEGLNICSCRSSIRVGFPGLDSGAGEGERKEVQCFSVPPGEGSREKLFPLPYRFPHTRPHLL